MIGNDADLLPLRVRAMEVEADDILSLTLAAAGPAPPSCRPWPNSAPR